MTLMENDFLGIVPSDFEESRKRIKENYQSEGFDWQSALVLNLRTLAGIHVGIYKFLARNERYEIGAIDHIREALAFVDEVLNEDIVDQEAILKEYGASYWETVVEEFIDSKGLTGELFWDVRDAMDAYQHYVALTKPDEQAQGSTGSGLQEKREQGEMAEILIAQRRKFIDKFMEYKNLYGSIVKSLPFNSPEKSESADME